MYDEPWWSATIPVNLRWARKEVKLVLPDVEPLNHDQWISHCKKVIVRVAGGSFYIGISGDPLSRYEYHREKGYTNMSVIAVGPSSSFSATLEVELIKIFSSNHCCANRSIGGEGASSAQPHYVYIVWRHDGMLRQSGGGGRGGMRSVSDDFLMFARQRGV